MRFLDYKIFRIYYDPYLFFSIFFLSTLGLFFLYSASQGDLSIFLKQSAFVVIGLGLMILVSQPDPQVYFSYANGAFFVTIALIIIAIFFGPTINGANRWIDLGVTTIQPSEFCKIFLPVFLSAYLVQKSLPINFKSTLIPVLIIFACFMLVSLQPDLGTATLILLSGLFILFLAGLNWRFIGISFGVFILSLPFLWNNFLAPFQKQRIATLLNPESDPFGSGWNIAQSKIAIGSGGFFGKGFGEGTQANLYFLPESETDFIFAVIGEEFGLFGISILMLTYFFIFFRCIYLAITARDRFCRLVIGSLSLVFISTFVINVGMVIGILPVVGMPLPFVSQGGSSIISFYIAFGIIVSMASHKKLIPR